MTAEFTSYLERLEEPSDYFKGLSRSGDLAVPDNLLFFKRTTTEKLQQKALQNRSHHRFVLIFNLGTSGYVHVNHHLLPFHPGECLLVFPFQFHHFSQLDKKEVNWLFCTFELKEEGLLAVMRNRVVEVNQRSRRELEQVLEDWTRTLDPEPPGSTRGHILQTGLLKVLLCLKESTMISSQDIPPEPVDNLLRDIHQLLLESSGRVVRINDLAEKLRLSEGSLRARFKEVSGISLGRYLQNFRLNRAMSLLRTTHLSLADVAEEAGFASPQAFSRTFKQGTGISPHRYRVKK